VPWKWTIDRFNRKLRSLNQAVTFLEDSLEHTLAQQYAKRFGRYEQRAPQPLRQRILNYLKKLTEPIEVAISSDVGNWFQ